MLHVCMIAHDAVMIMPALPPMLTDVVRHRFFGAMEGVM